MEIILTVADHEKNGFIPLGRWTGIEHDQAMSIIAAIDTQIDTEAEPDIETADFTFILDLNDGSSLVDTGKRNLPLQIAMKLAPEEVSQWLVEKPEPDDVYLSGRMPPELNHGVFQDLVSSR